MSNHQSVYGYFLVYVYQFLCPQMYTAGADPGGAPGAHPPIIEQKNMIFWRKIVIFHTKYPKIFAPPSARRNFFKCGPPPRSLKSWIRPCTGTQTLENTEGTIQNRQFRETDNIGQENQIHDTLCVEHHNTQTNTCIYNVNKSLFLNPQNLISYN